MFSIKKQFLFTSFIFSLSFAGEGICQINAVFIESPVKLDGIHQLSKAGSLRLTWRHSGVIFITAQGIG